MLLTIVNPLYDVLKVNQVNQLDHRLSSYLMSLIWKRGRGHNTIHIWLKNVYWWSVIR